MDESSNPRKTLSLDKSTPSQGKTGRTFWRLACSYGFGTLCPQLRSYARFVGEKECDGHRSTSSVRAISEETVSRSGEGCAEQLARFFRGIEPVEIPVNVSARRPGNAQLQESVVVEFCGRENAIFRSELPLEYNDDVRLVARGKAGQLNARVVAVQYHEGLKAVAVRFEGGPCPWVTTT